MEKARLKKPDNPKERNLIKGAIRRVFSRSELRKQALAKSLVQHHDETRKRVTKWSKCPECQQFTPTYKMEVDHVAPIIGLNEQMEDLTWDELVARIWCDIDNLRAVCKDCHKIKTKLENSERRKNKKVKNVKD
jgi:5-methylcytosine-specific restriction endonuclease McrA